MSSLNANACASAVDAAVRPSTISVRDVSMQFPVAKRYRELILQPFRSRRMHTALTGANLEVEKGDRIAIMGPNGAGKTTLLKLIGGLLLPSVGDIVVNGYSTVQHNTAARKSVGFVLNEERSFFWRLSAVQNLEFFGALDNLHGKDLQDRLRDLLHLVGLEKAADKPIATYSSGMKQRLALARGLIADPEVLILDEPTRALDPVACDELVDLILSRIHTDSGKTLLIATHRPEEALRLCNKVLVIDSGRLRAFDVIDDLVSRGVPLSQYYRRNLDTGEVR
ncbi:MAG TPA: ABC transporter ATP-binding protein [Bryobacteraceae bacterium]|nr:ABC transporter ATP-binding protein [Bryobacteraceae bacterium]